MSTVFIIHGAHGTPEENWFPWLKRELEALGCEVIVPCFPTPKHQSLSTWMTIFNPYMSRMKEDTLVIGHSLGCAFLLFVLEQLQQPIKAAFFVAGFVGCLGNPSFDSINKTFVEKPFDWGTIKNHCGRFFIYHADNDPYVPLEKAHELAGTLDEEPIIIKNAGHFNEKAGYTQFVQLLEQVKHLL